MAVKVSVIMTVYNTEKYIADAIDSILHQTFSDFEFIIIDDASTDGSRAIIESYKDERIKKIMNECNLGAAESSNLGLRIAEGSYIARMDSDDLSKPERLMKQVAYMEANSEVDILGSWIELVGDESSVLKFSNDALYNYCYLLFNPSVAHPAIMIRKSTMDAYGIRYNTEYRSAIDFELYSQFPSSVQIHNLQEIQCIYRKHGAQMSNARITEQQMYADRVRASLLGKLGISPSEQEKKLHRDISFKSITGNTKTLQDAHEWLLNIQEANRTFLFFDSKSLSHVLSDFWYSICHSFPFRGLNLWRTYFDSPFSSNYPLPERELNVNQLLEDIRGTGISRVAIFGTGRMGCFLADTCQTHDLDVVCFLDNNGALHGNIIDGIEVRNPEALANSESSSTNIILSIVGDHDQALMEQLKGMLGALHRIWNWKDYR